MKEKILKNKLVSGSLVMIAGSLGVNVVNYFYHLVMGRLLGPSDYSVLASIFSLFYLIGIVPQSAGVGIVKFTSEVTTQKDLALLYGSLKQFVRKLGFVMALAIFLFSPFISHFLHLESFWIVSLLAPVMYFSLITMVNQSIVQGKLLFGQFVGISLISSLGKFILGLVLVILGYSAFGAIFALALAAFITYTYSCHLVQKLVPKPQQGRNMEDFFNFSKPALLQALSFAAFFTTDLILVKHYFPEFDAGLYAALSTLGKIIFFAASPISMVMFPVVSGKRAKGESYRQFFYLAFFATAIMALGAVVVYWLFPGLAIGLLYGSEYLQASSLLVWMGLFISFYTFNYYLVNFLLSVGRVKVMALPVIGVFLQFFGILFWHRTMAHVICVSLATMVFLFIGLIIYLLNHQYGSQNAKK